MIPNSRVRTCSCFARISWRIQRRRQKSRKGPLRLSWMRSLLMCYKSCLPPCWWSLIRKTGIPRKRKGRALGRSSARSSHQGLIVGRLNLPSFAWSPWYSYSLKINKTFNQVSPLPYVAQLSNSSNNFKRNQSLCSTPEIKKRTSRKLKTWTTLSIIIPSWSPRVPQISIRTLIPPRPPPIKQPRAPSSKEQTMFYNASSQSSNQPSTTTTAYRRPNSKELSTTQRLRNSNF